MKINETRKRSLLKAVSFRIIEVALDSLILSWFVSIELAITLAIILEGLCLALHYGFERGWNKIQWGRHIIKE
jgi:dolichol kinase